MEKKWKMEWKGRETWAKIPQGTAYLVGLSHTDDVVFSSKAAALRYAYNACRYLGETATVRVSLRQPSGLRYWGEYRFFRGGEICPRAGRTFLQEFGEGGE